MLAEPMQHPHSPWIGNGTGASCVKQRHHHCGLGSCHVAGEMRVAALPHSPWIGNGTGAGCVKHGGVTTTGPDATHPPTIFQNSGGGGGGGGGVQPGVGGGGSSRGSGEGGVPAGG